MRLSGTRFIELTKVFTPYQSATLNTIPGNPNDSLASIPCLGCHDGKLGTAVVNTYIEATITRSR